ncbi:hypothetical protein DM02DRAFT_241492 [Periconia macrospinosa]|uniref:Mid2 domain-containing protein n=1 Tax=Periconia macrospinosa TaxID=97972 RepID=A0A2V1D6Q9_9PLEO|nr:hypothetical protein DM02DRAFT_241492 [Periconia macrospinosa]
MYRVDLLSIAMKLGFCMWVIAFALLAAADSPGDLHAGITPTASLKSVITPPPAFHAEVFKRALATCGYIRGNTASPLTCADGYNCVTTAHRGAVPVFACCNNIECVQDWDTCQEYGQNICGGLPPPSCSSIYGSVLKCSSEAPHCYRYARSSTRGDFFTYYSSACGTASSDILVLATATNGNQDPASKPAGAASNPPTPGSTYAPYPGAPSRASISGTKSKLSTRSIVLIVIFSGVALFVALVLGYLLIHQRRKQNRNKKNSAYIPQPPPAYPPMFTNRLGTVPVYQWNNGAPGGPPEIMPTVHEMTAPVRPLHEMPGGSDTPTGRIGPLSDLPPTYGKG